MAKRIWLFPLLTVLGSGSATTFAKPGDLPVDIKQQCPDAREPVGDGWTAPADTGGLAARPLAGADAPHRDRSAQPTERDPEARPVNRLRDAHHRVRRPVPVPVVDPYEAEASRLFALGERCRQIGDYGQARVCFEEAHLVSPTSVAGRLAIDRLREMRRERFGGPPGAAEEAETFGPSYSTQPRIAAPQRPAVAPRDRAMPRRATSQPGTSPARQPQLPPLPTPSIPSDLHRLKEMMDSTVPLGGAEEQEISARPVVAPMSAKLETIEFQPLSSAQQLSNERITVTVTRGHPYPDNSDREERVLTVGPPQFMTAADLYSRRIERRHHLIQMPVDRPLFETGEPTVSLCVTIAVESGGDLRQSAGRFLPLATNPGSVQIHRLASQVIPAELLSTRSKYPLAGWMGINY